MKLKKCIVYFVLIEMVTILVLNNLMPVISLATLGNNEVSYNGIIYKILSEDNKTVYVKGVETSDITKANILSNVTINGEKYNVTSIGELAFFKCEKLVEVSIPNTINTINQYAFLSCTSLKEVTIPGSVPSLRSFAFNDCTSLEKVVYEEGCRRMSNNGGAFLRCTNLKEIVLPKSMSVYQFNSYFFDGIGKDVVVKIREDCVNWIKELEKIEVGEEGNKQKLKLDIIKIPITSASFSVNQINTKYGKEEYIKFSANPSNNTEWINVRFKSGNADIATVTDSINYYDQSICVNAVGLGKTNISACIGNRVIVTAEVNVDGNIVKFEQEEINIRVGETKKLDYYLLNADGEKFVDDDKVSWSIGSNIIDMNKGTITAKKAGTTTVTVTCGRSKSVCKINVINETTKIVFSDSNPWIEVGKSKDLYLFHTPNDATDKDKVVYSSSKPEIVSVDQKGKITVHKKGEAIITATLGDIQTTCTVTGMYSWGGEFILNADEYVVDMADTEYFTPEIYYNGILIDNSTVDISIDRYYGEVCNDGRIKLNCGGECTLRVSSKQVSKSTSVKLKILQPIQKITIIGAYYDENENYYSIEEDTDNLVYGLGSSVTFIIQTAPMNIHYYSSPIKSIEWKFEDKEDYFAEILENNNYYFSLYVNAGKDISNLYLKKEIEVIVTTEDNHVFTKKINFIAGGNIPIETISLNKSSLNLEIGKQETISVTEYLPEYATQEKKVTWSSSNNKIATVQNGIITAVGEGTAVITAKCGNAEAKCSVTVSKKPEIKVTQIVVEPQTVTLKKGETQNLKVELKPEIATNKEVTYTSSNPESVSIDKNGKITALDCEKTAKITITSKSNPEIKAEVEVKTEHDYGEWVVTEESTYDKDGIKTRICKKDSKHVETEKIPKLNKIEVTQIAVNTKNITLKKEETYQLKVTVKPDDATNKEVTYTSSNPENVSVDQNGKITALDCEKTAKITITSKSNPEIKAGVEIKTEHDFGEWKIAKQPTWAENGEKERVCKKDSKHMEKQVIRKLKPVFIDLVEDAWYLNAIQYVYENGLMNGYTGAADAGKFGPEDQITRGQIVTILYRREGSLDVSGIDMKFDDVGPYYYYDAIKWATENGIVTGHTAGENAGKFMPDDPITREQLALILQRYAKYKNISVEETGNITGFKDYEQVSPWALEGLKWVVSKGIVTGDMSTTPPSINPQGNATRAQAATMIMRFCENVK